MSAEQSSMLDSLSSAESTEVPPAPPAAPDPAPVDKPDSDAGEATEKHVVDADKPDTTKEKLVPLAELRKSREETKELKRQIDSLQSQPKLSAEDAQLLKDLKAQRAAPVETPEPDFMEDPKGYVDVKLGKAMKTLEAANKTVDEVRTQQTQQAQLQALVGAVQAHETAFTQSTPDYIDALTHLRTVRQGQLKMMYPQASDQQIGQAIMQEELQTAQRIIATGGNPAEFAYNYAKTVGYAKKAAAVEASAPDTSVSKDAARSLGGHSAAEKDASETEDSMPELTQALMERFGKRKR